MTFIQAKDISPNKEDVKPHFTAEQYNFIYEKLGGWQGFSYLSGFQHHYRDYPLMVGVGYMGTARLRVIGKNFAYEFTFDQVDAAFAKYREHIYQRIK